ncbi:tyrosine integrase [Mycobacterium phage Peeb]|nr:tyrosine integrase [Mycobacterium phage Peeb]
MSASGSYRPRRDAVVSRTIRSVKTVSDAAANGNVSPVTRNFEGATITGRNTPGPAPVPAPRDWMQILDDYLDSLAAAGYPSTTRATRAAHIRRIARGLGVSPENVTGASLVRFFAEQEHWARETRRGYRNTCVSFFGWACREGRIPTDPSADLPSIKPAPPAPRPAPDRVYRAALMAADARVMLMLRLAAELGLRRAEVAQVSTSDLTEAFDGYVLVVHGKGGKNRTLPVSDELAELIARGAAGHTDGAPATGYLFPGDDAGHLSPRWVGRLCGDALPDGWTMHKLRHRFATRAYRGSRNLRAVQTMLGHASVATTEIYTAVEDAEVRAAMMAAGDGDGRPAWMRAGASIIAAAMILLGLGISDAIGGVLDRTADVAHVLVLDNAVDTDDSVPLVAGF